ncbi:hypothetical protein [Kordiimonas aestuarii]|uniref:hypothetical protein n=1 Tax=Kordiimonas aestuarii TaxID=1005925 RepID=UPI0021D38C0F|nr:hypothetical protein [Kordiimonas aestuarii]
MQRRRSASRVARWGFVAGLIALQGLMVAAGPAVLAFQGRSEDAPEKEAITLYRPIGYYRNDNRSFSGEQAGTTPAEQTMFSLLDRVDMPVQVRYVPLKRALSLYGSSQNACIIAPSNGEGEPDIVSDVFYSSPFWVYVLKSSGITSYHELTSYGTIDGADVITGRVLFGALERTYAPNFQSLIAMLRSGRVQAIPLGELALANEPGLEEDLVRLDDEPFVTVDMRVRCKRTVSGRALVDMVNAVLAGQPAP